MTSLTRKASARIRFRAHLLAAAALLLPVALLARADLATAQTPPAPPEITVYHSGDGETGEDLRPDYPPGCVPGTASADDGGWVVVVADVDAVPNATFYENVLGSGTQVLVARDTFFSGMPQIVSLYSALPGVTVTENNATVTSGLLAGVDLLMFHQNSWDNALAFTPAELTAIGDFLANGGNVLSVMETDIHHGNFNQYLSGIGSSIQFTTNPRIGGAAVTVFGAPFTSGVGNTFNVGAFNVLSGGTSIAVAVFTSDPIVAAEQVGGSPAVDCVLGGGTYEEFDLWFYGGSTASNPGETRCKMDELEDPGGSGDEICGAELTFELEGIGRFVEFTPGYDVDGLVLGVECLPNEGSGCWLPEEPATTLLQMNWRRGFYDPYPGRRHLGTLAVNSAGLDPATNYTQITVFGSAAGAKLQLRPISSDESREIIADSRMTEVPEPGQLVQLLSGLFGLAGLNRLRRRR